MAGLPNEVGTIDSLTKNAPKFSPNILSIYFVGPKKVLQNSRQIFHKISLKEIKKINRRASTGTQGEQESLEHPR